MAGTETPFAPPVPTETTSLETAADLDARVIVFNCECHTYEQVIALFCQ
jgi:ATP-dependent Clp protease adaptor protein ClpS